MTRLTDLPTEILTMIFQYAGTNNNAGKYLIPTDYNTAWALLAVNNRFLEIGIDVFSKMDRRVTRKIYWTGFVTKMIRQYEGYRRRHGRYPANDDWWWKEVCIVV